MAFKSRLKFFLAAIVLDLLFLTLLVQSQQSEDAVPCALRSVSTKWPWNRVCVCNSTYCDTVPTVTPVPKGQYVVYSSSIDGLRFAKTVAKSSNTSSTNVYKINKSVRRQSILGFGGAFTDAAGINIANLSADLQKTLIASYYSKDGIEYTIGRVPIASCDFSTHTYSYNDVVGDLNLTHFALAPEDLKYKIPYLLMANSMSPDPVKLFGSAWSSPAWMKTNDKFIGKGTLIGQPGGQYYKTWANYHVKFLQAYREHNIEYWGLTTGNEPRNGFVPGFRFQDLGFTPELQRDFVKMDLGPALHAAGFANLSLMMFDDQRPAITQWTNTILSDADAAKYLAGVAVHWYGDGGAPPSTLTDVHNKFPDKFMFATEACQGSWGPPHVDFGAWGRAKGYMSDIIDDLNNWVTGWTDWNIALDMTGGPNWVSNFVDSPIIVDAEKKEFYKQPMFYAMGHFSKFLRPGSVWVEADAPQGASQDIQITAFERPDKAIAVVIHNKGSSAQNLTLTDGETGSFPVSSPGQSVQTVLWW